MVYSDEFVLSASTVAFMETCILRSLFPCNDKANDEWLQSTADFTKQRIRFHSENPRFRQEMFSILDYWFDEFPVMRTSRRRSDAAPDASDLVPRPDQSELAYPDLDSISDNIKYLRDEAAAAAGVPPT